MKLHGRRYKRERKRLDRKMTRYMILGLNDCCGFVAGRVEAEERERAKDGKMVK